MNIMDIKYTCKKGVKIHPLIVFLLTWVGWGGATMLVRKGLHVSQKILRLEVKGYKRSNF